MGYAIDALGDGVSNVLGNPMLLVISFAVSLLLTPVVLVVGVLSVILSFIPIVGQAIAQLLFAATVKPVLFASILGPAGDGFAGDVSFGDAIDGLKQHTAGLVGAFSIYEIIRLVLSFVLGIVVFLLIFAGSIGSSALSDPTAAATGLGIVLFVAVAVPAAILFAVAIVLQFVDVSVVLGERSVNEAFKESWRLTREAPASVLGYSVLRVLLGTIVVLPGGIIAVVGTEVADVLTWLGVGVTVLLTPVAFAVVMSYHAAYYGHRIRAR